MKQTIVALFAVFTLLSCKKEGISIPEASLSINLNSGNDVAGYRPQDSVLFKFSNKHSKEYVPGEDSLNSSKQANDLRIFDGGRELTVDAIPYIEDTIPLRVSLLRGSKYKFVFKFSATHPQVKVEFLQKEAMGETQYADFKYKVIPVTDGTVAEYIYDSPLFSENIFSVVFKRK